MKNLEAVLGPLPEDPMDYRITINRLCASTNYDGEPTDESLAAHILDHKDAKRVYKELVRANDTITLDRFISNTKTRIKATNKTLLEWLPSREGVHKGMAYGLFTGTAIGIATHPELLPLGYTPQQDLFHEIAYRVLVGIGIAGSIGSILGSAIGKPWQLYHARKQTQELKLPPPVHDSLMADRKTRSKWMRRTATALLSVAALHNIALTYMNQRAYEPTTVAKQEVAEPVAPQKRGEPPLLAVKVSDITDARGYKPNPGEYVYGLMCGEGITIAHDSKLIPTANIDYYDGAKLKEQFLKDNASITTDINMIPANGTIYVRDVNGDGKIQFVHPPNWNCDAYKQ